MAKNPYGYEPLNKPMDMNPEGVSWLYKMEEPDFFGSKNNKNIAKSNEIKLEQQQKDSDYLEELEKELGGNPDISVDESMDIAKRLALRRGRLNEAIELENADNQDRSGEAARRERDIRSISALATKGETELAQHLWDQLGYQDLYGNFDAKGMYEKNKPQAKGVGGKGRKVKPAKYYNAEGKEIVIDDNDPKMKYKALKYGYDSKTRPQPKKAPGVKYGLTDTKDSPRDTPKLKVNPVTQEQAYFDKYGKRIER